MVTTVGIVGTKGGTGKTSTAANLAGLLADMAYRVLLIDADPHASLSKYYALSYTAPCGIVEFLLATCLIRLWPQPSQKPFTQTWTSFYQTIYLMMYALTYKIA